MGKNTSPAAAASQSSNFCCKDTKKTSGSRGLSNSSSTLFRTTSSPSQIGGFQRENPNRAGWFVRENPIEMDDDWGIGVGFYVPMFHITQLKKVIVHLQQIFVVVMFKVTKSWDIPTPARLRYDPTRSRLTITPFASPL